MNALALLSASLSSRRPRSHIQATIVPVRGAYRVLRLKGQVILPADGHDENQTADLVGA